LSCLLLFACLFNTANAEILEVLNLDFETAPPNFQTAEEQQGDATASFEFDDVGNSGGLIFKGTYLTKDGVDMFENALGVLNPIVSTTEDFHLYPSETDGVSTISTSMDVILEGLTGDSELDIAAMVFGLQLWQVKDGQWDVFQVRQVFTNKTWVNIGWPELTAEDFLREDGAIPDFSATAEPIVFAFFVGVGYKWVSGSGQAVETSARVDNWKVEADVGLTIFGDSFD
jgi:hypothetical protein